MIPSLYIHIPFCRRKCIYCDFYSVIESGAAVDSYTDILIEQMKNIPVDRFHTIYIGGGTPTVLNIGQLKKLLKGLERYSKNISEFTIEANPESLDKEKAKLFFDSGINRISIGFQSAREEKLKKLGRIHTARKAEEAVAIAGAAGFKNISIDLIFGLWDESPEEWKKELEYVVKLDVTHVSCYALTYEKHTPLFDAVKNKSIVPLDDDIAASMYEIAIDSLALRGFKQYEVSNFAKSGFECAHNMNYWRNNTYIGLGAGAVSYMEGRRGKNVPDVKEYIRRYEMGRDLVESSEKLSPIKRAKETAAVKIRTRDGIDFKWFKDQTGYAFCELERKALPKLIENGLVKYKKDGDKAIGIALKRKGFLLCDTVSSALL